MAPQKYPIGIQTFSEIITEGYAYVDKTAYIPKLLDNNKYCFLSRPRRFGKSLLISTLQDYFEGRRELFKGLAVERMDKNWSSSPVIRIDFNNGLYLKPDGLENRIATILSNHEKKYGLSYESLDVANRFESLIASVFEKTGRKVVILVDEYDKPLLNLEEDSEIYHTYQTVLKAFFGNLKTMDQYIRFGLITGVARFSKVSIFSDLNNLRDISMDEEFADICGWTEKELELTFAPSIEALANDREESYENTLNTFRQYYDGYLFSGRGSRLYNPYIVLTAFRNLKIESYWFETGTPTLLARHVKESGLDVGDLSGLRFKRDELLSIGQHSGNPIPLMFQTGYLTIDSYEIRRNLYSLRFPNREVEIGFSKFLLPLYAPEANRTGSQLYFQRFNDDIFDGHPEAFMKRLKALFAGEAYRFHSEAEYQSLLYIIMTLAGADAEMERHTSNGRTDLEIKTDDYIYIFEIKYNKSVGEAMEQIYSRGYAERFALDPRKKFLIGINFIDRESAHGIENYKIETIN